MLLIVATEAWEEDQVTDEVTSCELPSENVPVAVNCSDVWTAMVAVAGVTVIEVTVGAVTDRLALPPTCPKVAVIVADPCALAVASPPATVATPVFEELHAAELVKS